jgi:hypothetical protein
MSSSVIIVVIIAVAAKNVKIDSLFEAFKHLTRVFKSDKLQLAFCS